MAVMGQGLVTLHTIPVLAVHSFHEFVRCSCKIVQQTSALWQDTSLSTSTSAHLVITWLLSSLSPCQPHCTAPCLACTALLDQ